MLRFAALTLAVVAGWMFSASALAQDEPAREERIQAELVSPPRLVRFVAAQFDAARLEDAEGKSVELALTIGADGLVTEVEVKRSAGEALDQAAVEAARQFIFDPARRDWKPVPSRIRYKYTFEIKMPFGEALEAQRRFGRISGRVLLAEDDAAPGRVGIEIIDSEDDVVADLMTQADGRFIVADLAPGTYEVIVLGGEFGDAKYEENVTAGEVTEVVYRLGAKKAAEYSGFGATAIIDPPPREAIKRTISKAELTRVPGTRGDALRTVEILPGVARPPFGVGFLIVRGSAPTDSEVFIEGISVPLLYHFGGLTSIINSRLLEQIDFVPGNFSVRYGRRTGGILEVTTRDPADDKFHGMAELSVIDATLMAEGPIGDKVSVAGSVRRSIIDLAFNAFAPDDIGVVAAPVYYDYQAFITWRPTKRDRVRFMAYGSNDRFEIIINDEAVGDDPSIRGNANFLSRFHYVQVAWDRKISNKIEQDIDLQSGPIRFDLGFGDAFNFQGSFVQVYGRGEWRFQVNEDVRMIAGVDLFFIPSDVTFEGPQPRQLEGGGSMQTPLAGADTIEVRFDSLVMRPAVYYELNVDIGKFTRLILGARLDYFDIIDKLSFDPRGSVIFTVTDQVKLKAGAGLYTQPPEFPESIEGIGNPELKPIRSAHFGLGTELEPGDGYVIGLEGFYKHLWDRVLATENGEEPFFVNGGLGRIYGLEVLGKISPENRNFFGYLSYTLSRSERKDGPGEPWRAFDFDQRHIFTASFVYRFKRNWEVGGTFRLVTGNPNTPVIGSVYDAINDVYIPIDGPVNSIRNPAFHRLDIRVEKQWIFSKWKLALFLDIQNAYNRQNQEGIIYNFDFSQQTQLNGLPIIPSLGLRGEL